MVPFICGRSFSRPAWWSSDRSAMLMLLSPEELSLFAGPGAGVGTGLILGMKGTGLIKISGFFASIRSLSSGVYGTAGAEEIWIRFSNSWLPQTHVLS